MAAGEGLTAVEQEIADGVAAQPLIGPPESFEVLTEQLKGNEAFLRKLPNVAARYAALRRVRGDGNCFFRAFIYSLLQQVSSGRER
jgi:ubiquitin thioesterase protein OTUB1